LPAERTISINTTGPGAMAIATSVVKKNIRKRHQCASSSRVVRSAGGHAFRARKYNPVMLIIIQLDWMRQMKVEFRQDADSQATLQERWPE
jgi:hypothetical protein